MNMHHAEPTKRSTRIRASANAIKAALSAMQESGLSVDRVCVTGGKVEIHCGGVDEHQSTKNDGSVEDAMSAGQSDKDGGLEDW